jgi:hypothetical protein
MENKEKAITPEEILNNLENIIPSFVFEAINNLLKNKFRGNSVTIKQDEIIAEISRLKPGLNRNDIFEKKWLDFEKVYNKSGWSVTFDKPSYNETYDANFTFKPKK